MRLKFLFICIIFCTCCNRPPPSQMCLRLAFNAYPTTLDPRKSSDFASCTLISLLYEGLTRCSAEGEIQLALAEKIEILPDQKTYFFTLRKALWSNGKAITAYDFEKSWKQIIDPEFPAPCSYLLYPIKNAELCAKRALPVDEVAIQALSASVLRVELEQPTPYFLSLTAFPLFAPVPQHTEEETLISSSLVCSGPFQIEKILANQEILFTKSKTYWNPQLSSLDTIQVQIVPDESTALQMFERGELDWLGASFSPIHLDALDSLQNHPSLHFFPAAATTFCSFNTERFPFHNSSLRKAFSYAINRSEIVEKITQTSQIPATRYLPPSLLEGQNKELYPSFDPQLARQHLAEALKELQISTDSLKTLTLYFGPSQIDKRLAQALQQQWKEGLDIEIQLKQLDLKTQAHFLQKRNYEFALTSWIAQYHDPINILERFKDKDTSKNYSGWQSEAYIQLLQKASWEKSSKLRREILEEAEELVVQEMPIAPIYHWKNPCLWGPRIEQIATTPTGGLLLEQFQLRDSS